MSNIDKQALREIAAAAVGAHERLSVMPPDDIFDISLAEGTQLDADITALNALNSAANPTTVLALLDELEAKDKRIADMEAREVVLPRAHDVHPLGPQSAKIFCEFHRSIVNRCADEIRKVGVKVSIKGN
ncbi:ead/Ea22-like family protein [Escherichia coli]